MEQQLATYRKRKATEYQMKPAPTNYFQWFKRNSEKTDVVPESTQLSETNESTKVSQPTKPQYFDELSTLGDGTSSKRKWLLRSLKLTLWLFVWGFFIECGFGSVYFLVSAVVFVYLNTATGPKSRDAPSAYSVFNPNCERLDGTFTAEQFEKELRYGAMSVH